ncbi:mitochondrial tRNA-specific 2-thiouridylase 1 [Octopus bimaculoides]|uniref:tRNA-5-taurinomethyluridine 2-sulfurtransferase n=1 Tax=Octopus bimaculoides TaxID=37653 RepID=A0A0L8HFL1_OCTBM|nr:mitochondrial tRNA-specific 2-thiouridylase 1 [Octopus bimaculoides]|eukprot:XP_014773038.1 PREDICTED: mitochondrial tRNA-specific 2-thiouridylase 1-like [Octopus bimaculoides]
MINGWKTVVCGISGGVDSAVAAILLRKTGYNVLGLYMRNWDIADENGFCAAETDFEDAQYTCDKLKIPLHQVNFVKEYWNNVFSTFLQDYQRGLTPNPDILCNKYIKFDAFLQHALGKLGADAIATGHYARVGRGPGNLRRSQPDPRVKLLSSVDSVKDQTFFLSQISQESLQKSLFPIGNLPKKEVREIACSHGLEKIARKKESMGICFIGSRNFSSFIKEYVVPCPGNFVDVETGKIVGQHQGIHFWTLGQRTNLGGHSLAYFVAEINPNNQEIIVAPGTHHAALFRDSFIADKPHWIHSEPEFHEGVATVSFRFQHIHPLVTCQIHRSNDNKYTVTLEKPLRAICPGQYAVFYKDEECLGSARILTVNPSYWRQNKQNPIDPTKDFL